jgi:formate hydrogenlyase subunit 4
MMMMLSVEPVMTIALIVGAIKAQTLTFGGLMASPAVTTPSISMIVAGVAFFLALQAGVGKLPFDIAEADQEIMEGPFIERSGPGFALFKWALHARMMIFAAVLVSVFFSWWYPVASMAVKVLITLVVMLFVLVVVGIIDVVNPRLRVDQSMSYYARVIVFVVILALALAVVGH